MHCCILFATAPYIACSVDCGPTAHRSRIFLAFVLNGKLLGFLFVCSFGPETEIERVHEENPVEKQRCWKFKDVIKNIYVKSCAGLAFTSRPRLDHIFEVGVRAFSSCPAELFQRQTLLPIIRPIFVPPRRPLLLAPQRWRPMQPMFEPGYWDWDLRRILCPFWNVICDGKLP